MKVLAKSGNPDIATVYVAKTENNKYLEFVESVQPPLTKEEKWVLIISTLYGCPVKCKFCDSGGFFKGRVSTEDMIAQVNTMLLDKFDSLTPNTKKFKIQFARMGEPAYNDNVLEVLSILGKRYKEINFLPSLSTIAPSKREIFLYDLLKQKKELFPTNFQMQFSIHSTDNKQRQELIPVDKWSFKKMNDYGKKFFDEGGKKLTLNFAAALNNIIEPEVIAENFDSDIFLIKLTPVNPTYRSIQNSILLPDDYENYLNKIAEKFHSYGFETIISIGELEENNIGSNCGQHLLNYLNQKEIEVAGYNYNLVNCEE